MKKTIEETLNNFNYDTAIRVFLVAIPLWVYAGAMLPIFTGYLIRFFEALDASSTEAYSYARPLMFAALYGLRVISNLILGCTIVFAHKNRTLCVSAFIYSLLSLIGDIIMEAIYILKYNAEWGFVNTNYVLRITEYTVLSVLVIISIAIVWIRPKEIKYLRGVITIVVAILAGITLAASVLSNEGYITTHETAWGIHHFYLNPIIHLRPVSIACVTILSLRFFHQKEIDLKEVSMKMGMDQACVYITRACNDLASVVTRIHKTRSCLAPGVISKIGKVQIGMALYENIYVSNGSENESSKVDRVEFDENNAEALMMMSLVVQSPKEYTNLVREQILQEVDRMLVELSSLCEISEEKLDDWLQREKIRVMRKSRKDEYKQAIIEVHNAG